MALIDGKQFRKITRKDHCDDEVSRQIRDSMVTTMLPDEDIVLNHSSVTVVCRSKGFLFNNTKMYRYNSKTDQGIV